MKTFHACMTSDSSSGHLHGVSGTEQKLKQCFSDAGCTEPPVITSAGAAVDEEEEGGARPGQLIANAVTKCTNKVKQEDIHPKLQTCMSNKISGWQFPDLTHEISGHKSQAADQMQQLKRKYTAGIQSSCTTRQAKTEARKCFKSLRRELGGGKGDRKAHKNAQENPQKREQCVQGISQECRATFDNVQPYMCECAKEHLRDQRTHLTTKFGTCVRAEVAGVSMNPEQTQKMERAIRKSVTAMIEKCKGQGRGNRRRGQGQGRRQKGGSADEEE